MGHHRVAAALALAVAGLGVTAASQAPAIAKKTARLDSAPGVQLVRTAPTSRSASRPAQADAVDGPVLVAATVQAQRERAHHQRILAKKHAEARARARAAAIAARAWHLPVTPGAYVLTARFGQVGYTWSSFHTGLDFAAPIGTPIHAVSRGVIISAGWDGAYGYLTRERLANGTVLYYGHQNQIAVHPGQVVSGDQVIGYVGATGNVTGPHVHLEVRHDHRPVNPFPVLVSHGLHP